jgi:hypothetical protein
MNKAEFDVRMNRITGKMADIAAAVLADIERRLAPTPAGPLTPADAGVWRWTNDQFRFWTMCVNRRCKRARRCCGEPRLCLDRHLPQVPRNARDRVRHRLAGAMRDYRSSIVQGQATSFQNHSPSSLNQHGPTP